MTSVPMVVVQKNGTERAYDIFSRLLEDRIIILNGEVNDVTAEIIMAQLLYLDSVSHEPIHLYINSPGGSVTAGLAIYDTMQAVKSDVCTYCTGLAASMGSVLLAGGAIGKRYCMANAEVMIHQPLGGSKGQATDIEINCRHIIKTREKLERILTRHTGKPLEQVHADCERDNWLDASEALSYGLVDEVIGTPA